MGRFRPDDPSLGPGAADTPAIAPSTAPTDPLGTPPRIVGLRCEPASVIDGGTIELFVELSHLAPADGTDVAITLPWPAPAMPPMTVPPGTTTGQRTLVVHVNGFPGKYAIKAAGPAGDLVITMLDVSVNTATG